MPHPAHTLITALQDPALYDHAVDDFTVIETHISWVLLTGPYAYKIKKPVDLGFLDFSTLERRRVMCEAELRLNRRLAAPLYVAVVAITGSPVHPQFNGPGPAIEYAVKMRQFDQGDQFDRMLARGALTQAHMDEAAAHIARFHAAAPVAPADSRFGTPELLHEPVRENFAQIEARLEAADDRSRLEALRQWSEQALVRCRAAFAARKAGGFIRECHGDLHLRNIALFDHEILFFDCIEFSDTLRWLDVMSEVAFMVMDLDDRDQPAMASRFLNDYLQISGDYAGLAVLRYYLVYRAMVRSKVDCIRAHQPGIGARDAAAAMVDYRGYISLAERYTHTPPPLLLITRGLSGSGKTTLTDKLLETLPAIRLRSDVERKRLYGLTEQARSGSAVDGGLYSAEATHRTYARLAELAEVALNGGFNVIVDATFLRHAQREPFRALATRCQARFLILDCQAPESVLRARITARTSAGRDASEATLAVLERQLQNEEPLQAEEQASTLTIDTGQAVDANALTATLQRLLNPPDATTA